MNITIKRIHLTKKYKKQRYFVLFDCGPHFVKRYGVMGLTTKLFKYTKYFDDEQDAVKYYFEIMIKFKDYKEVTSEWESRSYL